MIFTDFPLLRGAFALEAPVSNAIRSINQAIFDVSREHGSAGRLQSIEYMDALTKYPDDPERRFRGENSTLSILGQETGHRWLAFLEFRDDAGARSQALLGRADAHWSFFFDSEGSVVEGNDIEDLGGGRFQTGPGVFRYSLLDQYAMGLVDETEVPPMFYVADPQNILPGIRDASSAPERGVTFTGTRRDVTIDRIIAAHGRRVPAAAASPRVYRQAFIYVTTTGTEPDPAAISKMDRIRVAWEQFFSRATDSRMRSDTRLRIP